MARQFFFILFCTLALKGYAQTVRHPSKAIAISIPVIANFSEATYYALGNPKHPDGKGVSYGLNINYSTAIFKNVRAILGAGYFRQAFGIQRPFNYKTPDGSKPLVYTRNYIYHTYHFLAGVGYQKELNDVVSVKAALSFNWYDSFKQKYNPKDFFVDFSQINHTSIALGNTINLAAGMERKLTNRFSAGADFILPVSTNWNNDGVFFKYEYADDTQQIARNRFSAGAAISCSYHF